MALRTVLKMHTVLILMEATLVPVHLGILEMELSVTVGGLVSHVQSIIQYALMQTSMSVCSAWFVTPTQPASTWMVAMHVSATLAILAVG